MRVAAAFFIDDDLVAVRLEPVEQRRKNFGEFGLGRLGDDGNRLGAGGSFPGGHDEGCIVIVRVAGVRWQVLSARGEGIPCRVWFSADKGSFHFVRLAPHFAQDDRFKWMTDRSEDAGNAVASMPV